MKTVRDLTIPFADYAHVSVTESLAQAIGALVDAMMAPASGPPRPRDRGVLVQDTDGRVVGKLSMWDLLGGLMPNFEPPIDPFGTVDDRLLWSQWLSPDLAGRASAIRVGDLIKRAPKYDTIDEGAPLDLAVHRLIRGRLLSMLVTRGDAIVGILRLSDVLTAIDAMIRTQAKQPAPA